MSDLILDPDLATLTERWSALSTESRRAILAVANVAVKTRAPKKAAPGPYNAVPMWCDAYKDRKYVMPKLLPRECKLLKELAMMYPQAQLKAMIVKYIDEKSSDLSMGVFWFHRQHNHYAAACPTETKPLDPDDVLAELEGEE